MHQTVALDGQMGSIFYANSASAVRSSPHWLWEECAQLICTPFDDSSSNQDSAFISGFSQICFWVPTFRSYLYCASWTRRLWVAVPSVEEASQGLRRTGLPELVSKETREQLTVSVIIRGWIKKCRVLIIGSQSLSSQAHLGEQLGNSSLSTSMLKHLLSSVCPPICYELVVINV